MNGLAASSAGDPTLRYAASVKDTARHAWIEVYYDYIGWLQFECTPAYYEYLYATDGQGTSERPHYTDYHEDDRPPEEDDDDGEDDDTDDEEPRSFLPLIIAGGVLLLLLASFMTVLGVLRGKADRTVYRRRQHIARAVDEANYRDPRFDTRALTRDLTDDLFELLESIGAGPEPGELTRGYGERLARDYGHLSSVSPVEVMRAVQKEEFGHGVSYEELCAIAVYTDEAAKGIWKGLSRRDRFVFRYRKHLF